MKELNILMELLDAEFVGHLSPDGKIISIVPDSINKNLLNRLRSILKAAIKTSSIMKKRVTEILLSDVSLKLAIGFLGESKTSGIIVVGMKENFDILAMKGFFKSIKNNYEQNKSNHENNKI